MGAKMNIHYLANYPVSEALKKFNELDEKKGIETKVPKSLNKKIRKEKKEVAIE